MLQKHSQVAAGCVLLPGVVLKQGAVLGAMSLAVKNQCLESFTIYVGSPAKFKNTRKLTVIKLAKDFEKMKKNVRQKTS